MEEGDQNPREKMNVCRKMIGQTYNTASHHLSRFFKTTNNSIRNLTHLVDLVASLSIDVEDCESVCLILGPYRNLTTLTAATLFLHPNCQVLNHAGGRIFGSKHIDFLADFSEKKLSRFIQYAIRVSQRGKKGGHGGSIVFSHAFDSKYPMKTAFLSQGGLRKKRSIRCLLWKESHQVLQLIQGQNIHLGNIFKKDRRLRFVLPIRNPMDCAISNIQTGRAGKFEGLNNKSTETEVVQAILDEIMWFAKLNISYPDRFFYYFEHTISRNMLARLALFLELEPLDSWLNDAVSVMKTKSSYYHHRDFISFYRQYVTDTFVCFPELSKNLLLFE